MTIIKMGLDAPQGTVEWSKNSTVLPTFGSRGSREEEGHTLPTPGGCKITLHVLFVFSSFSCHCFMNDVHCDAILEYSNLILD